MTHDLVTVPCLSDNYAFILRDQASGDVAVIDVPEAQPILDALAERGWTASQVWLTHHHWDHIDGLPALLEHHKAAVYGAKADTHRLPPLDHAVSEGEQFNLGSLNVDVLDVSGHTVGHIAFHVRDAKIAFTADSLMALGCGRLFEGTPAQMWDSMQKLRALPGDTVICSGHEYTTSNAAFARSVDPDNTDLIARAENIAQARARNEPTVPSLLSLEIATNPFLRPDDPAIRATLGMKTASDADVFAEIRKRKDNF